MKSVDYIIDYLVKLGVTDAFGIPGGVILDFIYALDARKPEITPHLTYHEQGAIFAACGYAQVSGKLGVAYATRGPGVTNMVTGIADAYFDSIPVLIVTAHSSFGNKTGMRIEQDQEMDPIPMMAGITKYAARVDSADEVCPELERACTAAMIGRPGPVLLDFHTKVFREEIKKSDKRKREITAEKENEEISEIAETICDALGSARRPVLLIGDGIRQSGTVAQLRALTEKMRIPVISSRAGQDLIPNSPYYFGFIGSHGTRCGNFILSKTDLIISVGNRMSFPVNSKSFHPILEQAKIIQIDVDKGELEREIPNCISFYADLRELLPYLATLNLAYHDCQEWMDVCRELKIKLYQYDFNEPIKDIATILEHIDKHYVIVSDVGNQEFWLSHAYGKAGAENRILYSKSFGALGCSIGKAIGAYYETKNPVICFMGDQGFQMNIQELQTISSNRLPICMIVVNNQSSGMIRSRQKQMYQGNYLHTTRSTGYGMPNLRSVTKAYGMGYHEISSSENLDAGRLLLPCLVNLRIDEKYELVTNLLPGKPVQNLSPELPEEEYRKFDLL